MKLTKLFLTLFISLFVFVPSAQAKVIIKEDSSIVIEKSEVITDDLYLAGDTVDILGTVNGDVYVGAGVVNFSGQITGDLVIGAGQVTINGQIGDDLIIGAGNVNITDSTIGDGLIVGAGSVTINDQSKINGSLIAGTGMLDNQASVLRNLMVGAGKLKHNASVGGEAYLGGEELNLGPNTIINGDLKYASEKELQLDDLAVVKGEMLRQDPRSGKWDDKQLPADLSKGWGQAKYGFKIVSFFSSLIVGLALLWLFKKPTMAIAENIKSKFISSLGWGFILLLLTFPALTLLAITVVGFPLAAILSMLFIIDLFLAKLFTAMAFGLSLNSYFKWKKISPQAIFSLGLLALYLLRLIPGVGLFVKLISLLVGLGGLWIYKKQLFK
jgi:hypothetical protein